MIKLRPRPRAAPRPAKPAIPFSQALLDPNLLGAALGNPVPWRPWLAILKATFGEPLNHTAPSGERRRLLGVELAARGLDRFTAEQPRLADILRLPHPGATALLAFPREEGNPLGLLMAAAAAAVATKHAAVHSADWAAARERQIAQEQREAEKRQAEIDKQEREAKRKFERDLVEGHRARRVGRKQEA